MSRKEQPAIKSYFFKDGYVDLIKIVKDTFINLKNKGIIPFKKWLPSVTPGEGKGHGFWRVVALIPVFPFCLWTTVAIFIFGTLTAFILSLYHTIILLIVMIVIYILFSIIWIADRLYLKIKKISAVCPVCKTKMLIPTYKCNNCGEMHSRLTPGVYGILFRTCKCGTKLPTTFLTGRGKNATAICPNCDAELSGCATAVGRRPICIPIVGGRSAGKTAFIAAFTNNFREFTNKNKIWEISDCDNESKKQQQRLDDFYMDGDTRQTQDTQSIQGNLVSSVPVRFIISGKKFHPEREFNIYDISGEAFRGNSDIFKQNIETFKDTSAHYGYCHGIVFIVDPFAISEVLDTYGDALDETTNYRKSDVELIELSNAFVERMQVITGIKYKLFNVPIAIVISKIDAAGLLDKLGPSAINEEMAKRGNNVTYTDAEDYLCRKFLIDNGARYFLDFINNRFTNNRFFACSSMGHSGGKAFTPIGVMDPIQWIVCKEDDSFNSQWKVQKFTKTPILKNELK